MFRFFSKEGGGRGAESIQTVSVADALQMASLWNNDKLMSEVAAYEALLTYMNIDRAAADPLVQKGIVENIKRILADDCRIAFATEPEVESFVNDFILLQPTKN